ncbi:retrotransposon protein, putative, ty1-copia subclass [Tanacetum coccineum]
MCSSQSKLLNEALIPLVEISTDVMMMALPVQNINHSAFKSMFEREKLFGTNFNDWFCQLKLVLRVEKKLFVIEQPLPAAPAADSEAQEEGKSVSSYVLKMKGYVEQLERLGYVLPNYNMHNMGKTTGELHDLLIEYEKGLPKKAATPQVMVIQGGRIQKANKKSFNAKGKGKDKSVYIPKPKNPKHYAKEHPTKDDAYHHCKEVGHWKRNYHVCLAELIKKKKQVGTASSSGIFTIELFSFPNNSWVYDTDCGSHICNIKQGLRGARKLKQEALYLYVGNGVHAQVEAIGSYDLILPNGLVIYLDNCHYEPTITGGVVSVSRLVDNGFIQCFTDYRISVSKNNVLYFIDIPSNGIYEIDMINRMPNVNSIYNGKMTRKPFSHRTEKATDLLGITHIDVCGPLRHVSRQGASYFITFMDDYSRYGYVYLLKHKHEVFEIFKVFKNEVENQLGKTIKALRSDRGGEYINQEFKDYHKACGIVQQLTPSYTPQHKGVSERRNRTLLDMGCEAIVKRDTPDKLQQRSVKCIFIGYPKETMGYYFYFPPENKIVVARSARTHQAPDRLCLNVEVDEYSLGDLNEPNNYKAALLDPKSDKWVDAINAKIQSMKDNQVWCLVDLSPKCKTVGSKWLFKKNTDMDGIVHTYKARLVAKGYTQTYRVDYKETFLP